MTFECLNCKKQSRTTLKESYCEHCGYSHILEPFPVGEDRGVNTPLCAVIDEFVQPVTESTPKYHYQCQCGFDSWKLAKPSLMRKHKCPQCNTIASDGVWTLIEATDGDDKEHYMPDISKKRIAKCPRCGMEDIFDSRARPVCHPCVTHMAWKDDSDDDKERCGTGATRSTDCIDDRYDLLYWPAIRRVAQRFGLGAKTHGEHNFRDGEMPASVITKHMFHHLVDWMHGNKPEDDHLAAIAWGILVLMEWEDERPELIDLRFREVDDATKRHQASDGSPPDHGDQGVVGGERPQCRQEATAPRGTSSGTSPTGRAAHDITTDRRLPIDTNGDQAGL